MIDSFKPDKLLVECVLLEPQHLTPLHFTSSF